MSVLTRIKNNQILDSTIYANAKIVPGSIVGSLFNTNLTMTSDVTITGNLTVQGASTYLTVASTNTYVNDPLIVLNNAFAGTNTYDLGFVFNRGTLQNVALIWNEFNKEFRLVGTTETGTTYGNINQSSTANLRIGNLTVDYVTSISSLTTTGFINTSGNISAAVGAYGSLNATGLINTTGNISGAVVNTGLLNATGNILGSTATFNLATINGNITLGSALIVGGSGGTSGQYLQSTGTGLQWASAASADKILSGASNVTVTSNYVNVAILSSNIASFTSAGLNNTNIGATAPGSAVFTGVIAGNVAAGFIGNTGTAFTGASLNVSGNVLSASSTTGALTVNGIAAVQQLTATGNVIGGLSQFAALNATPIGNSTASTGAFTTLTATSVNSSGNILGTGAVLNSLTVNGGVTSTGYINTSGNISGAVVNAGTLTATGNVIGGLAQFAALNATAIGNATASTGAFTTLTATSVNSSGNVLGAAATFSSSQINGNESVTGYLNVTGNILGSAGTLNTLALNSTTNATESTGSSGALQIKGGVSVAKDVHIGGNIYVSNIFATSYNVLTVNDPLLYLTAANTYPYNYEIGFYSQFVGGAGNIYQHSGLVRDHNDAYWKFFSNSVAEPTSTITFDADTIYDGIKAGNLVLTGTGIAISAAGYINTSGNLSAAVGNFGAVNSTGFINTTGNISGAVVNTGALNATGTTTLVGVNSTGFINTTGNISGAVINGGAINSTGLINTTGNISAATVNAGQINTSGNVLANTITAYALGGIITTASQTNITAVGTLGSLNVTANVLAASFVGGAVNLSGNVLASTLLATLVQSTSGTFGNVAAGFIGNTGTAFTGASLNVSGNVLTSSLSAGQINTTGNLVASQVSTGTLNATGLINTTGNISAATVIAGQLNTTGNLVASQVSTGTLNATGLINTLANISASRINADTLAATGTIWANASTDTSSLTTGALIVAGGAAVTKSLWVGENVVINSSQTSENFQVKGTATTSLIYASSDQGAVVIGGSNTAPQLGSTLKVNGTDSLLLPVGSTAQRPSNTGNIDIAGMIRFNSTVNNLEYYTGSDWTTPGASTTLISDNQFTGNGVQVAFTLASTATTNGSLVSVNGVIQIPTTAYSVSGTTLTFTEAPAAGDAIDVRILTATSTVTNISDGFSEFDVNPVYANILTGTSSSIVRISVKDTGHINIPNGSAIAYNQTVINAPGTNLRELDSFSTGAYSTAKYIVQIKDGANIESAEVLLAQDTANVLVSTYAVLAPAGALGTFSANIVSGSVKFWYTPTISTNANIKVLTTYIVS